MQEAYTNEYSEYEKHHWWFRARREILRERVADLPVPPQASILEIGVGPGENLYRVYPPGSALVGVEPDAALAAIARSRGDVPIVEATVELLPALLPNEPFDAITLFDVLEHTEDDALVLGRVRERLVPDGHLVVTVPAFMFLWGQHDVVNLHHRRYTRRELVRKLERAGFVVLRATYFSTLLFPAVAAFRVLHRLLRRPDSPAHTDMKYSLGPIDRLLYGLFHLEKWLLRSLDLPVGTSVLVVAKRGPGSGAGG
jgi:SAM-dependent methyltransferase